MIREANTINNLPFYNPYDLSSYSNNVYARYIFYIEENKTVGYLIYEDIYDRFEIDYIYVEDNYRKKGVASKMLDALIHNANEKKVLNITLEVKKDNHNAIALYLKFGFISKAIRRGYYNGIDGILMEKEMM